MNKFMMMLLAMLCAGMLGFVACGDDDEDTEDKDSDVAKDSDKSSDEGGGAEDPFKDADCEGDDAMKCDYQICAYKAAYDTIAALDCSTMQKYCDDYADCYKKLVECISEVCPAGEEYNVDNADAITACATEVTTCTSALSTTK